MMKKSKAAVLNDTAAFDAFWSLKTIPWLLSS